MAEFTPTDKSSGIVVGTTAGSVAVTARDPLWMGVVGIGLLSFIGWLLGRLSCAVPIVRARGPGPAASPAA